MYKLKTFDFPNLTDLGQSVQLRELTADQFFDANELAAEAANKDNKSSQYIWLSAMLWVDGQQFSPEEIRQWGASITLPLLTRMTELFPKTFMDDVPDSESSAVDPNG